MSLEDAGLYSQVPQLLELVLSANAPNTIARYTSGWNRWRSWTKSRVGVPHLSAEPLHVALYILELTNTALQNGHGSAVVDTAVYSIRWAHKLAGLTSPVDHPVVVSAAEGARRKLARPVQPKEPISEQMLLKIVGHYNKPSASLLTLRFLFILLIGYAGLFRINEILKIRPCDIKLSDSHLSIFISGRKNDQHRDGHTSIIARSGKITCPVSITEKIMSLLPSTRKSQLAPIVRRVVNSKKREKFHEYAGICYSTALDSMRKFLAPLVGEVKEFATHSMKSGGASNEGFKSADPELKDRHAGWKNPSTKLRYQKRSTEELLEITKRMKL